MGKKRKAMATLSGTRGSVTVGPIVSAGAIAPTKTVASPVAGEGDDKELAQPSSSPLASPTGDTAGMSREEKRKAKKRRKEDEKLEQEEPELGFALAGFQQKISIKDIRELILHVAGDGPAPNWMLIKNKRSIRRVVCLLVPGIEPSTLGVPPSCLPSPSANVRPFPLPSAPTDPRAVSPSEPIEADAAGDNTTIDPTCPTAPKVGGPLVLPVMPRLFSHACPTKAPGDKGKLHSSLQALLTVPLTKGEKDRKKLEREQQGQKPKTEDPSVYTLTVAQLLEHDYPLPSYLSTTSHLSSVTSPFPLSGAPARHTSPFATPTERLSSSAAEAETERWGGRWSGDGSMVDVVRRSKGDGWVETPRPAEEEKKTNGGREDWMGIWKGGKKGKKRMRVLGVDCEMCQTTIGQELGRICVVDLSTLQPVYDTLVKPANPVVDYLTQFSGLTKEALDPVTTTLEDVQRHLLAELVDFDTILVGHSLESDLKVLKLAHPHIIDTALLYQHPRRPPFKPSLRWLAQKWLNKEIQRPHIVPVKITVNATAVPGGGSTHNGTAEEVKEERVGHDPEEDARTCLELLQAKLKHGPFFGEFGSDVEPIFSRLARCPPTALSHSSSMMTTTLHDPATAHLRNASSSSVRSVRGRTSAVVDYGDPSHWHGAKANTCVAVENDDEVVEGVVRCAREGHDFTFGRFSELATMLGWIGGGAAASTAPGKKTNGASPLAASSDPSLGSEADAVATGAPITVSGDVQDAASSASSASPSPPESEAIAKALTALNDRLERLHSQLPANALLILLTGHSDPRAMSALNARRAAFEKAFKKLAKEGQVYEGRGEGGGEERPRWTTEDERTLEGVVERARMGLSFYCVTRAR